MTHTGNEKLLERELTAFLCSRRCPDEAVAAVENWLNTLDPEKDCIVCGGHSGIEKRVVVQLMERGIPLVWMVAEAGNMKWQNLTDTALQAGKLLIVSTSEEAQTTSALASERNSRMISMAKSIVIAYMDKGGMIEKLVEGLDNVRLLTEQTNMKNECFCIRRDGGNIYFDIERGMSGKYIKISQTRKSRDGGSRKECVFVNASELNMLKKAVDWAMAQTQTDGGAKEKPQPQRTAERRLENDGPMDEIVAPSDDVAAQKESSEGLMGKIMSVFKK